MYKKCMRDYEGRGGVQDPGHGGQQQLVRKVTGQQTL